MNRFPTNVNGINGPFGVNDNNFNRQSVPSNNFMKGSDYGGEVTSQFSPMTTTMNSMANFKDAFVNPTPMIEKIDYINKNDVLHNNIGPNVLDEHVVEYRVMIDSVDRDIKVYPDPFSYVVKFNPAPDATIVTPHHKHIKINGTPAPHINRAFENVKYVKLENVILPQHSNIKHTKDGYVHDPNSSIITNMYNTIIIPELSNERIYTTSQIAEPPFALIIPDKIIGLNFYSGTPYYGSKIYKNSMLGNLSQLHIQFANNKGEPLHVDNLYTYDEMEEYEYNNGVPMPLCDMRNPYNPKLQNHISLIIGVVECQINTNTKFDK